MPLNIAVVGQGVSGVSTTLALLEAVPSLRITVFGDRPFEDITSWGPAGYFEVIEAGHRRWGAKTFSRFAEINRQHGPVSGVKYVSGQCASDDREEIETIQALNADIVHNFRWLNDRERAQLYSSPVPKYAVHFSSFTAEGKIYVPWMKARAEARGAVFARREIVSLAGLADEGFDVVINCTGLAGGRLAGDDGTPYPLRGVVFEIDAPGFKHFSCHGFSNFVLPLNASVLVGTVRQRGRYDRAVTDADRREILNKVYAAHPGLKGLPIIREWCGLRPGRETVRVERQTLTSAKGDRKFELLHNYGHSSNGFTLSWGTAQDVVGFVRDIIQERDAEAAKKSKI